MVKSTVNGVNGHETRAVVGSKVNRSSIGAIASSTLCDNGAVEQAVTNDGSVGTLTKVASVAETLDLSKAETNFVNKELKTVSRLQGQDVNNSVVSSSGHVKSAQLRISDRRLSRSPERKLSQEVSAMVSKFEALAASGGATVSTHSGQQRTNLE